MLWYCMWMQYSTVLGISLFSQVLQLIGTSLAIVKVDRWNAWFSISQTLVLHWTAATFVVVLYVGFDSRVIVPIFFVCVCIRLVLQTESRRRPWKPCSSGTEAFRTGMDRGIDEAVILLWDGLRLGFWGAFLASSTSVINRSRRWSLEWGDLDWIEVEEL